MPGRFNQREVVIRRHPALGRVDRESPEDLPVFVTIGCDQPARIPRLSARSRYPSSQNRLVATSGTMTRVFRAPAVLQRPESGSISSGLIARVHSWGTFGPAAARVSAHRGPSTGWS